MAGLGSIGEFTVVLPVKRLAAAKSRLGATAPARAALALAMAQDVALVAASIGPVLVVTDDPVAAAALPAASVEPDLPWAGLSAAVGHGAAVAAARWPATCVVVLAADLPALTVDALGAVVDALVAPACAVAHGRATSSGVVADADGVGTVLLAAPAGTPLVPAYEGGSFARHRVGGAADLTPYADGRLRRDVDTVADLAAALDLGVGPATAAAVAAYRSDWRAAGLA